MLGNFSKEGLSESEKELCWQCPHLLQPREGDHCISWGLDVILYTYKINITIHKEWTPVAFISLSLDQVEQKVCPKWERSTKHNMSLRKIPELLIQLKRSFHFHTDYKPVPLVPLLKTLDNLSVRIQRFHIHLMKLNMNQISKKCYVNIWSTRRVIPPELKRFLSVSSGRYLSIHPRGIAVGRIKAYDTRILQIWHPIQDSWSASCRALPHASNWKNLFPLQPRREPKIQDNAP